MFDRPVLPDRNYRGGSVTLTASLTAIKKDTVIAGMLKSAASASLGVVAGMVQTATLAGPAKILGAAGDDLIAGVKKVLTDQASHREPLFDFSGFEYSLQPTDVIGPEIYILLHRGREIPEGSLSVRKSGQLLLPYINDEFFGDGAWLLLRIRRSSQYPGVRDWFDSCRALRTKLKSLVEDFRSAVVTKDDGLKRLKPSSSGNETLFDDYSRLRSIISSDGVLSEAEAAIYITGLFTALNNARISIEKGQPETYISGLKDVRLSLMAGTPGPSVIRIFGKQLGSLNSFRLLSSPKNLRMKTTTSAQEFLRQATKFKGTFKAAF